jgi:hypothetical protein
MPLQSLSAKELELLRGCLVFVARTPRLEGEFDTRLGITRSDLAEIIMRWPAVSGNIADRAIGNTLNELVNGLNMSAVDWGQVGSTHAEVSALHRRWLSTDARPW